MANTNFQTIFQMPGIVNNIVKQATGRDSVSQIDMDFVTVGQDKRTALHEIDYTAEASFVNNNQLPLTVLAKITAVQDLHGYDHPWPAGGGKNKLKNNLSSSEINGLTVTVDNDGVISFSGTSNAITILNINTQINTEFQKNTSYILSGCSNGAFLTYRLEIYKGEGTNVVNYDGETQFELLDTDSSCVCRIIIQSGVNMTGVKIYPMIRLATDTDATYVPYSNICPITGWTGATITQTGGETENTYSITFPEAAGTVYGGVLNVTTGVLTVTMAIVDLGTLTSWRTNDSTSVYNTSLPLKGGTVNGMSSALVIVDPSISAGHMPFNSIKLLNDNSLVVKMAGINTSNASTMLSGITLVYELATVGTYQLTPTEIDSLIGENNLSADTGDISVSYTSYIPVP